MTQAKHTPGPWVVGKDLVGPVSRENDQSYGMIMPVVYIERHDFPDSHEANARLISAAPDLLEALKDLVYQVDSHSAPAWLSLDDAFTAIAKATGADHD